MKRSKFTEEQITYALRQHDAGIPVGTSVSSSRSVKPAFGIVRGKRLALGRCVL